MNLDIKITTDKNQQMEDEVKSNFVEDGAKVTLSVKEIYLLKCLEATIRKATNCTKEKGNK